MTGSLVQRARKAAGSGDYAAAMKLYAEALSDSGEAMNLDLRMRYAWCAAQAGDRKAALTAYAELQRLYRDLGEVAAAEALGPVMAELNRPEPEKQAVSDEPVEPISLSRLADVLCGMGRLRQLNPGERLCEAGGPPDALWLLQYGTLRVELPEYDEPEFLHASDRELMLVGEIGVFTRQRRLATVVAETDCGLVEVPSAEIYQREADDPAFAEGLEELMRDRWVMPVLSQHAIFNRINDVDRRKLVDAFEIRFCEPGEVLVEAGSDTDGCFMLQSGCLFYMHSSQGRLEGQFETETGELVVSVLPGDIVHLGGLLQDFAAPYRIVCATPVQVLHLSRRNFQPFLLKRPWIMPAILQFSRKPAHLQVMRPADDYLWSADRRLSFSREEEA